MGIGNSKTETQFGKSQMLTLGNPLNQPARGSSGGISGKPGKGFSIDSRILKQMKKGMKLVNRPQGTFSVLFREIFFHVHLRWRWTNYYWCRFGLRRRWYVQIFKWYLHPRQNFLIQRNISSKNLLWYENQDPRLTRLTNRGRLRIKIIKAPTHDS